LKILIEYDNCLEQKGPIKDSRLIEVNTYGKASKMESSKITINNTKAENQILVKLCIDNAKSLVKGKPNPSTIIVLAQAHINLAEVQTAANERLNFFIPLKVFKHAD
jgi:hypothetical protein